MTYGIRLPNSGPFAEPEHIQAVAREAERCGFWAAWVHDHIPWAREMLTHFSTGSIEACANQDPNFFETVGTVAYIAGICPSIHVGIAGLVLPLRDPRVLAKQLMSLQALVGGRLITALAIGNVPKDFEVMQVPYNKRGKITDEYLEVLSAIYRAGPSSHEGSSLTFSEADFYPKPTDPRFWIAGNSPPAYRRIARFASGWLPGGLSPEEYRESLSQVAAAMQARDRDVREIERGVELYLCLEERHDDAVTTAARSLEHRFRSIERGLERNIIGGPDAVLEKLEAFRQAGVSHFEFRCVGHTIGSHLEMMELFQATVAPHVERVASF